MKLATLLQGVLVSLILLVSAPVMASLSGTEEKAKEVFDKKFQVLRDGESKISAVVFKMNGKSFSADALLQDLIAEIKNLNKKLKATQNGNSPYEVTEHQLEVAAAVTDFYQDYELAIAKKSGPQYAKNGKDVRIEQFKLAMEAVQNNEVVLELDRVAKSEAWKDFNFKLSDILLKIRPDILSVPNDQKYFFQRDLIKEAIKLILSKAAQQFPAATFLSMLNGIFKQIEGLIADQRMFNQNFLLYLLENYKPELFGMNQDEAAKTISSIYQSRLGLLELARMKKMAEGDWTAYGWNLFYTQKRTANAVLQKFEGTIYTPADTKRLCSAFAIVVESGKKKIVNLFDKSNMFSSKPSLAYDFEKPKKVKTTRLLIKLGQMALGFIPIPGAIKDFANNFADSTYKQQVLTEGALSAYFLVNGYDGLSDYFVQQTLNPFLR